MSSLQEDLFYAAYFRTLTDAGCTAMDFAAAVAVLKHSQSRFVASLEQPCRASPPVVIPRASGLDLRTRWIA